MSWFVRISRSALAAKSLPTSSESVLKVRHQHLDACTAGDR
jgi:hypothetical protein